MTHRYERRASIGRLTKVLNKEMRKLYVPHSDEAEKPILQKIKRLEKIIEIRILGLAKQGGTSEVQPQSDQPTQASSAWGQAKAS
jgi:hypothetical protein